MPVFTGAATADTLLGGPAADTLQGLGGNDVLIGGDGNDLLDGGPGVDTMIGGAGDDLYLVNALADRAVELAGGGFDTIRSILAINLSQAWASGIEALVYTGAAAATLVGNDLDNRLTGGAAGDTLRGGAGADTLDGAGGADRLEGGVGDDLYLVGAGDLAVEQPDEGRDGILGSVTSLLDAGLALTVENLFYTGAAAALAGNGLDNVIAGGTGADTLSGADGADSLAGGLGADRVEGDAGDDLLSGGRLVGTAWSTPIADAVADTLVGGAGNDTYLVTDLLDVVIEGPADGLRDTVIATVDTALTRYAGVEVLVLAEGSAARVGGGSAGADLIIGNAADNLLAGGDGVDTLSALGLAGPNGTSPDVLDGGAGADLLAAVAFTAASGPAGVTFLGGTGNDTYVLGLAGLAATGFDAGGIDTAVLLASADLSQMEGIERIILSGAALGLTASDRLALAAAQGAVDAIHVALTHQAFEGAIGPALDATGTAGANAILGNGAGNRLRGGGGNDTILGGAGADTLDGGSGIDRLVGGLGNDVLFAETGDVVVELAGGGFDIVHSTTFTSLAGLAHIEGLQFLGTAGVSLDAGLGNVAADFLGGGSGDDSITGRDGADTLAGAAGNDLLTGNSGDDSLSAGLGNDSAFGALGDDRLDGGDGQDFLDGGGNSDTLRGGTGRDTLTGGDGRDSLLGEGGADLLFGDSQNDWLIGGAGNDTLFAGSADFAGGGIAAGDILYGDNPSVPGIVGADIFVFDAITTANAVTETFNGSGVFAFATAATVADFQSGIDRIRIAKELVGDLDTVIDGVATANAAGTFSATAELVFFATPLASALVDDPAAGFLSVSAEQVDAVIGSAAAALAVNATRLFVLGDGSHSALFVFQSANGDAAVTIDELFLFAVVANLPDPATSDFALF